MKLEINKECLGTLRYISGTQIESKRGAEKVQHEIAPDNLDNPIRVVIPGLLEKIKYMAVIELGTLFIDTTTISDVNLFQEFETDSIKVAEKTWA